MKRGGDFQSQKVYLDGEIDTLSHESAIDNSEWRRPGA